METEVRSSLLQRQDTSHFFWDGLFPRHVLTMWRNKSGIITFLSSETQLLLYGYILLTVSLGP